MSTAKKVIKENSYYTNDVVSDKVKDRGADSFFVKKAEEAKDFLKKNPLPEHLKNK